MLTQPPNLSYTSLSETQPLTEDNRTHHQAERPTSSPCEKSLRNRHSALPCENSGRTGTLPGWNLEISGAASHPYAQCLSRSDLKSFLQEQDTRKYSFPHIGALRETIHEQIKTIILKHMYLGTSLVIQWRRVCLPMQGTLPIPLLKIKDRKEFNLIYH